MCEKDRTNVRNEAESEDCQGKHRSRLVHACKKNRVRFQRRITERKAALREKELSVKEAQVKGRNMMKSKDCGVQRLRVSCFGYASEKRWIFRLRSFIHMQMLRR